MEVNQRNPSIVKFDNFGGRREDYINHVWGIDSLWETIVRDTSQQPENSDRGTPMVLSEGSKRIQSCSESILLRINKTISDCFGRVERVAKGIGIGWVSWIVDEDKGKIVEVDNGPLHYLDPPKKRNIKGVQERIVQERSTTDLVCILDYFMLAIWWTLLQ
ncbi:hypothetical protein GLOIN_2v1844033 [Rhizophagus clarus]|uniref:Uncharacterized protein n=1 Tax=Rhizophagus clarus TaxID=94130 RepID=A0A8H3KRT3_9GLOM|nr:hypothetical protein GLOIN_2v1844033 [Rhizophagus clarus]